jgi:starch phosphorylase
MKALANGSLNLSVLDGWWDEGYQHEYGWALGHGEVYNDLNAQDDIESRDLYNLLEEEVVPLFYQRGHDDIPRGWVEKMKAGLKHLVPIFNAHRMVQEYMDRYYLPCSKRYNILSVNNFAGAIELASWRQKLMTGWAGVSVEEVISGDGLDMPVGSELDIEARIKLGSLTPEDVTVEAYYGKLDHNGDFFERDTSILEVKDIKGQPYSFKGKIPCPKAGRFGYTVRVMPSKKRLENPFIIGLVTWA